MDVGLCRPRASSSDFCSCTQQVSLRSLQSSCVALTLLCDRA